MKKFEAKSVILGILIGSIVCGSFVFATGFRISPLSDGLTVKYNGKEISLATKPVLLNEDGNPNAKTYIPLREFFEGAGFKVNWDSNSKTVDIDSAQSTATAAPAVMPQGGMPPEAKQTSVDTSNVKQKWTDVPYADVSATQKLDIYLPNEGKGPFPVIVSIHGGGFAFGNKTGSDLKSAIVGLQKGYAVVSVDYRLSGEAIFPAQIQDVKAAIRFIRANATKYNLNKDKIAVCGGSAGGALAALAGTSGDVADFKDAKLGNVNESDKVQAVVDLYGPVNFLTMDEQFKASGIDGQTHGSADSFESKLMGATITTVPDLIKKANPETYITSDDPAFFIQHGTADNMVPHQQSVELAEKLKKVIGNDKVYIELLEGASHADAKFSTEANLAKIMDFLDKVLK